MKTLKKLKKMNQKKIHILKFPIIYLFSEKSFKLMSKKKTLLNEFLNIIKKQNNEHFNPFIGIQNQNSEDKTKIFNPFGLYEDLSDFEIRCPICLGRTYNTVRPSNCTHFFCSLCLTKWVKLSNKCPVCRNKILSITKVDVLKLAKPDSQLDIFAKY